MNKRIAYKAYTTTSDHKGSQIMIVVRIKHGKKYHRTTIRLDRVSQYWLDRFDALAGCFDVIYTHHFTWGVVSCRAR